MRAQIDQLLRKSLARFAAGRDVDDSIDLNPQLERTRDRKHGDFTTSIALRLAKPLGRPPRELAAELADLVPESSLIADVNVAGPGFINLYVSADAYRRELTDIIEAGDSYGRATWGANRRVIVEYVSANPTGPLHVGHGRHAAYGACVASLMRATGHDVHEEYYVNDAGRQMDILTVSVWLRYLQTLGEEIEFPKAAYRAATYTASPGNCIPSGTTGWRASTAHRCSGFLPTRLPATTCCWTGSSPRCATGWETRVFP